MSLHKLLSEYASSDEDIPYLPERTLVWATIARALWDSGDNSKVKVSEPSTKKKRKDSLMPSTAEEIKAEAIEWLTSDSDDELSLRWWLELIDIDHEDMQPKLISQIGRTNFRKAFTCTSNSTVKRFLGEK